MLYEKRHEYSTWIQAGEEDWGQSHSRHQLLVLAWPGHNQHRDLN